MTNNKQEITTNQIKEWKKKHGNIFLLEVEDKQAYLKTPSRQVISLATSQHKNDPIKFAETIVNNCWLGGDDDIRTQDDYFLGAIAQINEIIQIKQASIKKALDEASVDPTENWISYMDTLLAYHLKIDASQLNDEQWAEKIQQLKHIREQEAKANGYHK